MHSFRTPAPTRRRASPIVSSPSPAPAARGAEASARMLKIPCAPRGPIIDEALRRTLCIDCGTAWMPYADGDIRRASARSSPFSGAMERSMSGDKITCEKDGAIARIVLDNPARHNAITIAMWTAAEEIFDDLAQDAAVRVVVISGAG